MRLASNYWIIFYLFGYFLPIPVFIDASDGWSTIWGFAFKDKEAALQEALLLATFGGVLISICSRGIGRNQGKLNKGRLNDIQVSHVLSYEISKLRLILLFSAVFLLLNLGVHLVGGIWNLLQNLGDRITLFAGLNAFFLPLNTLIGACFAITSSRAINNKISKKVEILAIITTIPMLFLLGQKSNILILILIF